MPPSRACSRADLLRRASVTGATYRRELDRSTSRSVRRVTPVPATTFADAEYASWFDEARGDGLQESGVVRGQAAGRTLAAVRRTLPGSRRAPRDRSRRSGQKVVEPHAVAGQPHGREPDASARQDGPPSHTGSLQVRRVE